LTIRVLVAEDHQRLADVIAEGGSARVLMLTAASKIRDRVDGLGIGADHYLID
jgi:hypothetical protein